MENILAQLIRTAFLENAVASQALANGRQLLVYPMGSMALVGLGRSGNTSETGEAGWLEDMLRRRTANLDRMGVWLPAMLADGSVYVVRRVEGVNPAGDASPLSAAELEAAEELLS
jgi:hypothetical protein